MFTRDQIFNAIRSQQIATVEFVATPFHAAVAVICEETDDGFDVCFIRRAEREGDPWSGHVSFPGGRAASDDPTAQAVAERETQEEIGLKLAPPHRIGPLPVMPQVRRGVTLFPFTYLIDSETRKQATAHQPEEVASVFWVPIRHLCDQAAVTTLDYCLDGSQQQFPAIQFNDHIIWGLTLHVLHSLAQSLNHNFPALD